MDIGYFDFQWLGNGWYGGNIILQLVVVDVLKSM